MNKKFAILGSIVAMAMMATVAQAAIKIEIDQDADVENSAESWANTGDNYQKKLVRWSFDTLQNGNQIITTGDADAQADALSVTNKNDFDITQRVEASRGHRGYKCENECEPKKDECDCVDVEIEVDSEADVENEAEADANTGDNEQKLKLDEVEVVDQNGVQDILTGRSDSAATADQYTNANEIKVDARSVRISRYTPPEL